MTMGGVQQMMMGIVSPMMMGRATRLRRVVVVHVLCMVPVV